MQGLRALYNRTDGWLEAGIVYVIYPTKLQVSRLPRRMMDAFHDAVGSYETAWQKTSYN